MLPDAHVFASVVEDSSTDKFSVFCLRLTHVLRVVIYIFTCTYRGTHTQAHMYNQHTREMATTGTGAWLRGAEERLCQRPCTHTTKKMSGKTDIHEFKERI